MNNPYDNPNILTEIRDTWSRTDGETIAISLEQIRMIEQYELKHRSMETALVFHNERENSLQQTLKEVREAYRKAQDDIERAQRETVERERIENVLDMVHFAFEVAKRTHGLPYDVSANLTAIWEEMRNELMTPPYSDIPF